MLINESGYPFVFPEFFEKLPFCFRNSSHFVQLPRELYFGIVRRGNLNLQTDRNNSREAGHLLPAALLSATYISQKSFLYIYLIRKK